MAVDTTVDKIPTTKDASGFLAEIVALLTLFGHHCEGGNVGDLREWASGKFDPAKLPGWLAEKGITDLPFLSFITVDDRTLVLVGFELPKEA